MEKSQNRIGPLTTVRPRGTRSFIRWHTPEEEQRLLEKARNSYAERKHHLA